MEVPGFRPRFKFESPMTGDEVTQRISERLKQHNPRSLWLKNAHYHITLSFQRRTSEAWTPQMDITFETLGQGRTMVRCLIGPVPNIWMFFAGGYLILTLLGLTGITLGVAQHLVGNTPWGYYMAPFALIGLGILIYLERTGRQRAQGDMRYLKQYVDGALGCDCLKLAEEQAL